ncbi:Phospholipase D3 [Daphnia magna]|uniref:Phospholipase D3 n=1 Tax=Daphnia magna TaxID=35525 RepID=A0A164VAA4_9CRUS|nr:Phospholipase D3 [Daphnia magna]
MIASVMKWVNKGIKANIEGQSTAAEDEGRFDMLGLEVGDLSNPVHRRTIRRPKENLFKSTFLTVTVILGVTLLVLFFPHGLGSFSRKQVIDVAEQTSAKCNQSCQITLVESIPEGLTYPNKTIQPSIFDSWLRLIDMAEDSIDIASFYWSLNGEDVVPHPSAWKGELVFKRLKEAGLERGIQIRIAQNQPSKSAPDEDTSVLESLGAAVVRTLDFSRLIGSGILHTKLWVVDGKHFFVGSANMDWRSLTQVVKELGATVYDCPCLAKDMSKIFEVYWALGDVNATIPESWPQDLSTRINYTNPLMVALNDTQSSVYLSSSPPQLCPQGRTSDLESVLHTMDQAHEYINIAVMDYIPAMLYTPHHQFWPDIDNQLRRLAINRGIKIRLLVSHWKHTTPAMVPFLKSLADISNVYPHVDVQVKIFIVPAFSPDQEKIPFARVNHNKYMVTDKAAYIGTSNWSGDYFISTGGVGLIVNSSESSGQTLQSQLKELFDRDWNSAYAHPLDSISIS